MMVKSLLLVASVTVSSAQGPAGLRSIPPSGDFYVAVLDEIFVHRPAERTEYRLRFFPGDEYTEMQAVFALAEGAACGVDVWWVPNEFGAIFDQLRTLLFDMPDLTSSDASKRMTYRKTHLQLDCASEGARLLRQVRELRIDLTGADGIFIHGSRYELSMSSWSNDVTVSVSGPSWPIAGRDPVHAWMTDVRKFLATVTDPKGVDAAPGSAPKR
jgi:hypothetical protein